MVTKQGHEMLAELVLEHISRYRISFPKVMAKVFEGQGNVSGAVRGLKKEKLIKPLGRDQGFGSVLGQLTAYQITPQGATRVGVTPKRSNELNEKTLEHSFRVLWLCCMGETRFSRLRESHLIKLLGSPLGARNNSYCMEMAGKRRIYRIRLLSAQSKNDHILRETRKDLLECADVPVLKDFVSQGHYGNILVVSRPERRKQLEERIGAQGLKKLGHVRVVQVPDLNEIGGAFRD